MPKKKLFDRAALRKLPFKALVFLAFAGGVYGARAWWGHEGEDSEASAVSSLPEASRAAIEATAQALGPAASGQGAEAVAPNADLREIAWEKMTDDLQRLAVSYHGHVAIYLRDLKNNKIWSYHPDDLFPSASLIKVPIMVCVFGKIREGALSLDQPLVMHRRNRVGGSGLIKWMPDGTRLSVRELLYRMIKDSDNTATAMLIDAVGMDYLQRQFPQIGLFYTEIYPEGMSLKGGRVQRENYTTAREMSLLLEKIYRGELVDKASSELMLDILKSKRSASRLAKGLPGGWGIAHKTGLLRQACHDSAVILSPGGDYALTVLTGQNSSYHIAKNFITRLGHITYRYYMRERFFARASVRRPGEV